MPRSPRKQSATGIYHIIMRGNEQQEIFRDSWDYNKFLSILDSSRKKSGFALYAWCLMPNHIHLLIKEKNEPVGKVIQGICSSYVFWYNTKYDRIGHLFQARFKSVPVEDETFFLQVVRYIHLNPVNGKLCVSPEKYAYSSYRYYFNSGKYADDNLIFGLISKNEFEQFHKEKSDDIRSDYEERMRGRISDEDACAMIRRYTGEEDPAAAISLPREKRTELIMDLFDNGASIRQINRLTGLTINVIRAIGKRRD